MNTELIEYYTDLLILQYRGKSKAEQTVGLFLSVLMIYDLIRLVENGYSLDDAVGVQLDIVGKYLGADRDITGIPFTRTYFGFINYGDDPDISPFDGFQLYGLPLDVQFLVYGESRQSVLSLNDEEFRQLLNFKKLQNISDHSVGDIDSLLYESYGDSVIMDDNKDMTMDYTFPSSQQRLATILASEGALPRPAGVDVNINLST